ncbi:MAG: Ig-like domain-containing protein [Lachnospiraceae bacterium]|nr:Ig-like domain-containing protein [Lachnospiraceae bacterium]
MNKKEFGRVVVTFIIVATLVLQTVMPVSGYDLSALDTDIGGTILGEDEEMNRAEDEIVRDDCESEDLISEDIINVDEPAVPLDNNQFPAEEGLFAVDSEDVIDANSVTNDSTWQSDFEYSCDESSIYLNRYVGKADELVIPAFAIIDGYEYKTIIEKPERFFYEKSSLEYVDLSNAKIENNNWSEMFANCSNLKYVDFGDLNNKVKPMNIQGIFYGCDETSQLVIKGLDTSEAKVFSTMFHDCENLSYLDLHWINTSNATDLSGMFSGCSMLRDIDLKYIDTSNATNLSSMFYGCSMLRDINLKNLDTSNATDLHGMFYACKMLNSIDVSGFDTSNVTNFNSMFRGCSNINALDLSNFDTHNATNLSSMFSGCSSLTALNLSNFDTHKVMNYSSMFESCSNIVTLDLSSFDTRKAISMDDMFSGCTKLKVLDVSSFRGDMSIHCYAEDMFRNCISLESIDMSRYAGCFGKMKGMFSGCTNISTIDLSGVVLYYASTNDLNNEGVLNGCEKLDIIKTPTLPNGYKKSSGFELPGSFYEESNPTELYDYVPYKDNRSFILKKYNIGPEEIAISSSVRMGIGDEITLNFDINDIEFGTGIIVNTEWSSSDENVVCVDDNGHIKGLRIGKAIVTCTIQDSFFKLEAAKYYVVVDRSINNDSVRKLDLSTNYINIDYGDTYTLTANITPENAANKKIIWTGGNDYYSIDSTGKIFLKKEMERIGNNLVSNSYSYWFRVYATTEDGELKNECIVTVKVPHTKITLNKSSSILLVGQTDELISDISPHNMKYKELEWISDDPSIASVDNSGIITANKPGVTIITCFLSDYIYTKCRIYVYPIRISDIKVKEDAISLEIGKNIIVSAVVMPDNATNKSLIWESSDKNVAVVDKNGKITALKTGSTIITAKSTDGSNKSASCAVNVVERLIDAESVSVSPTSQIIMIDENFTISASILPENATNKSITWTSGNEKVATVTETGVVTGIGAGTTDITATTSNGKTAKCAVTVNEKTVVVSFDVGTTEINAPNAITVAVNKAYGDLPVLSSRAGWKHLGWYTEKTGGTLVEKTTIVTNTKDHTLYAHWKEWDEEDQKNEEMNTGKDGSSITAKKIVLSGEFSTVTGSAVKFVIKDKAQKKLASITSKGVLSAKKAGKVTVTAQWKEGGKLTEKDVTYDIVIPKGSSLSYGILYYTGQTFDLNTLLKDNGLLHPNSWTTTAKSTVTTVDSKTGILTVGDKDGSATVYAIYGTDKNARKVKVSVKISHKKVDITKDFTPITGKTRYIITDKNEKKIASVTTKGILTAKKSGAVTVTLQVKNGKKWDDVQKKTYNVTNPLAAGFKK